MKIAEVSMIKVLTALFGYKDLAAEQSTMPYRAPELFDVKTGTTIDEKVDIWVSPALLLVYILLMNSCLVTVDGLPPLCLGILSFALRDHPDDRTRRLACHGDHERAVQVPSGVAVL